MNVLLTNDDGVAAPGLWAAARVLATLGRVTVVAPASNYSGYGAALPPRHQLHYINYTHRDGHPHDVTAYGLAGSPATCVQVGLSGVLGGGPFDLLVSGINLGANMGYDIFYSGTVGAALTAHLIGVPAIAVSLAAGPAGVQHWDAGAWALCEAVRGCAVWQADLGAGTFYNVNVPNLPQPELDDVLITSPGRTSFLSKYRFAPHSHEENVLAVAATESPAVRQEPWTDAWAVSLGYVSVTPFRAFADLLTVASVTNPRALTELSLLSPREVAEA
jgi:5'-nucleotidase